MKAIMKSVGVSIVLLLPACLGWGCASQCTLDKKIYRVQTPLGTNYYRVRVTSKTGNSIADYRVGWFPAFAVDLYLSNGNALEQEAATVEWDLRNLQAASLRAAYEEFTAAETPEEASEAATRLLRIQQLPIVSSHADIDALTTDQRVASPAVLRPIGSNPLLGLYDHAINKKLVIALSSDPDAILEQISAFAEEPATREALVNAFTSFFALSNADTLRSARMADQRVDATRQGLEDVAQTDVKNVATLEQALSKLDVVVEMIP